MSQTGDIKTKIKDLLLELVDSNNLAEVIVLNKPMGILNINPEKTPAAILANNSFSGERATNRDNEITHTFEILVMVKSDNIDTDTYLEDLSETLRKKFANNESLGGNCLAVEPSTTPYGVLSEANYEMAVFLLSLKVRVIETLT